MVAASSSQAYLDWNATNPPHPAVLQAMERAAASAWANPASVHALGRRARAELDHARDAVGALTGFAPRDVTLTSGGTEANNLALWQPFAGPGATGALVVSAIEHPSVLQVARALEEQGVEVRLVSPQPDGVVSLESMVGAMDTVPAGRLQMVSLQAVNHETGVVQPTAELASEAHARGALLHVDAVQAVGKLAPTAWADADLVSVAAHKIRGPKGIGALGARPGLRLRPLLRGGEQERGGRPGTQDPVAAAGFAVAAQRARDSASARRDLASLRDELERRLLEIGRQAGYEPGRNGTGPRTGQVSNLSWPGWGSAELCAALDLEGVAVSGGAACSAGTARSSPVVAAMLGQERAASAVRLSLGDATTRAELAQAVAAFGRVLGRRAPR